MGEYLFVNSVNPKSYVIMNFNAGRNDQVGFSKKLQDARKSKGFTLEELALKVDSTKSYIWALENKDNPNPSMKLVNDLAKALDVTVEYLVDKQPNDEDQVFFREYADLKPETKQQLRSILKALKQE